MVDGQNVQVDRINGPLSIIFSPTKITDLKSEMGYPSSKHPGAVNVAFCGGNVQKLPESIDHAVYKQLMTSNGKKSHDSTNAAIDDSIFQ